MQYVFNNWMEATPRGSLQWPHSVIVLTNALNEFVVQCFMTRRFWDLTRLCIPCLFLLASSLSSLGMSIVLVVFSEFHDRLGERYLNLRFAIACLGLSVLADFSITACLLYALYKPKILSPETRILIRQLAVIAVQTGCAPSFVAATCLIILCVIPETLVSTAFSMSIGCVYTCTMLFTLNKRAYLRGMNSWIHTTPYPSPDDLAPHCFQDDEESGSMKFARPPEVHTGAGSNSSWDRRIETSPRDALLRSDSEPETHLESPPSAKLSFSQHSPLYVSASPTSVASRTAPLTHP
ncbi:hypothetical protein CC2G_012643 [Coprinopsis cinerea AmutBmut pab1-1]|nr:hypothetical protein CC2G_012643 [Coprinopsis cinerea AmutBmut pab1-1]